MKNLDFKRAFDFVRSGENWWPKLLIGGFFYWLTALCNFYTEHNRHLPPVQFFQLSLLSLTAIFLLAFLPGGYLIQVIHNETNNKSDSLPDWRDFIKYIKYELAILVPSIAYFTPMTICLSLTFFFTTITSKLFNPVISLLMLLSNFLFLIILVIPASAILVLMLGLSYAENLKIGDCFKPLRMFRLFKNALPEFLKYFGMSLIINIPISIFAVLASKNILFSLVGFISFPVGIFFAHLSAQAYKYALSKEKELALAPAEIEMIDSDNI